MSFCTYTCFFFFSGGEFIFVGWSLWSCFRLYLGASLCILFFLALATFVLPCWGIHVRGEYIFYVSYFKLLIDLCL